MTLRFAPALAAALAGCALGPPAGPFVEYRPETTPATTRAVTREATYTLRATDDLGEPLAEHHVVRGERIGFRREPDGSVVAVAPGRTLALGPGAYTWSAVPGTAPSWVERVTGARAPLRAVAEGTAGAVGVTVSLAISCAVWIVYMVGGGTPAGGPPVPEW
jgi:hypothetical protein